jgi:hypothetical protein
MAGSGYPFAEKEKYYRSLSDCELLAALDDAKEAWIAQEEIEKRWGPGAYADKNSGWRADDFHTILKELSRRRIKSISDCGCGCNLGDDLTTRQK